MGTIARLTKRNQYGFQNRPIWDTGPSLPFSCHDVAANGAIDLGEFLVAGVFEPLLE